MNMRITLLVVLLAGLATTTACKRKKVPNTKSGNEIVIIERDQTLDDRESGVFSVIEIDWDPEEDLK